MGKQHKTAKGKVIDMEALRIQNEKSIALGNMGVNARGDLIGKGGNVVKSSQDQARQYNSDNPKAVKRVSIKAPLRDELPLDEKVVNPSKPTKKKKATEIELEDGSFEIVENTETDKK